MDETRVDRWLWSVRLYPTRTAAADAVKGGHVRVNGRPAKPATSVKVGDRIEAQVGDWARTLEVARVIDKRVGAAVAAECFVDHGPPRPRREDEPPVFSREPGAGRPTKRDRRALDRFRGR